MLLDRRKPPGSSRRRAPGLAASFVDVVAVVDYMADAVDDAVDAVDEVGGEMVREHSDAREAARLLTLDTNALATRAEAEAAVRIRVTARTAALFHIHHRRGKAFELEKRSGLNRPAFVPLRRRGRLEQSLVDGRRARSRSRHQPDAQKRRRQELQDTVDLSEFRHRLSPES